jgi:hypothetical protein
MVLQSVITYVFKANFENVSCNGNVFLTFMVNVMTYGFMLHSFIHALYIMLQDDTLYEFFKLKKKPIWFTTYVWIKLAGNKFREVYFL